jgi:sugar lactone lactonase YvrE
VDAGGNLFVSDGTSNVSNPVTVRKVSGGIITAVVGGDFNLAVGLAVDAAGNLFIADSYRLRKVAPTSIMITTVAGTGTGFSREPQPVEGGSALLATFTYPQSVALDQAGNLFVAETGSHRVRKVSPSGIIATVAGNGSFGFSGDGGQATQAR